MAGWCASLFKSCMYSYVTAIFGDIFAIVKTASGIFKKISEAVFCKDSFSDGVVVFAKNLKQDGITVRKSKSSVE